MKKKKLLISFSGGKTSAFMTQWLLADFGAEFSPDRKYRYSLWRIWDRTKPLAMFIGLNPSTANETEPDNTIKRVGGISKNNGYGGFYMTNCFPIVSSEPKIVKDWYYSLTGG